MKFIHTFITSLKEPGSLKTLVFHTSWALTLTSGMSYFFGFLRDRIFAQTFGLSRTLDIYNAAFVVPDTILQVIVMAALSAPFIPLFTKKYDHHKDAGMAYVHQFMSWAMVLLLIGVILCGLLLPYFTPILVPGFNAEETKEYLFVSRLLLVTPFLFALSSTYGKLLLAFKEFFWWGLAPALYNIGIVTGTLLWGEAHGTLGIVAGTLIGVLMHLSLRLTFLKRRAPEFSHRFDFRLSPEIKETFWMTLPKLFQYGMVSVLLLKFTSIATELGEGAVAAYNYARNFQSIPVSLLGIAISLALYSSLCHDAAHGDYEKFKKDVRRDWFRVTGYTTLAAIALAFIAPFLVQLLLGGGKFDAEDVRLVSRVLQIYCLSVPLESLMYLYHRVFYALRNTVIPSLLHTGIMILTVVAAKSMAPWWGIYAIPASFSAGLLIQILILSLAYPFVLKRAQKALA